MVPPKWIPDIVVGIDFGMTCTGMPKLRAAHANAQGIKLTLKYHRSCLLVGTFMAPTNDCPALAWQNDPPDRQQGSNADRL
jgi:hypothetical protein